MFNSLNISWLITLHQASYSPQPGLRGDEGPALPSWDLSASAGRRVARGGRPLLAGKVPPALSFERSAAHQGAFFVVVSL